MWRDSGKAIRVSINTSGVNSSDDGICMFYFEVWIRRLFFSRLVSDCNFFFSNNDKEWFQTLIFIKEVLANYDKEQFQTPIFSCSISATLKGLISDCDFYLIGVRNNFGSRNWNWQITSLKINGRLISYL